MLNEKPIALYSIVLRRVGSIKDSLELQLLIHLLNCSSLMDTKVIQEEHHPLLRMLPPELLQELHIAILVEGALLNHIAL